MNNGELTDRDHIRLDEIRHRIRAAIAPESEYDTREWARGVARHHGHNWAREAVRYRGMELAARREMEIGPVLLTDTERQNRASIKFCNRRADEVLTLAARAHEVINGDHRLDAYLCYMRQVQLYCCENIARQDIEWHAVFESFLNGVPADDCAVLVDERIRCNSDRPELPEANDD